VGRLPRAVVEARFALQDSAQGVLCCKPKRCLRPSMAAPAYLLIGAREGSTLVSQVM